MALIASTALQDGTREAIFLVKKTTGREALDNSTLDASYPLKEHMLPQSPIFRGSLLGKGHVVERARGFPGSSLLLIMRIRYLLDTSTFASRRDHADGHMTIMYCTLFLLSVVGGKGQLRSVGMEPASAHIRRSM